MDNARSTFNVQSAYYSYYSYFGEEKIEDIIAHAIQIIESFQNPKMASNKWANITGYEISIWQTEWRTQR